MSDVEVSSDDIVALQAIDAVDTTIPLAKLVELRKKSLSYSQIATLVGCTPQNVHQRLQAFIGYVDHIEAVKDNQADMLAISRGKMLDTLMVRDHTKEPTRDIAVSYGILTEKERLLRDKSTSNVVYVDLTREHGDLNAERVKLEAELGLGQDADGDAEDDAPWTVDTDDSEVDTD